MPRVNLARKTYAKRDFAMIVPGRLKQLGITQAQIAKQMGIKQSTFSRKLSAFSFDYDELVELIDALKLESRDVYYFMTGLRGERNEDTI